MTSVIFDINLLAAITEQRATDNMRSVLLGLIAGGKSNGLDLPHRLVPYLAQLSHESAGFKYDREIWGPTAAQRRYDIRTDLGNTPERDGDGQKYAGHTAIQITGRYNTSKFRDWVWAYVDKSAPDFVDTPHLMNTDPWEGLGPIWYWSSRNLNKWADSGEFDVVSKKINGGYNGYSDRCRRYTRIGLLLLGFNPSDIAGYQRIAGLRVDGSAGPKTRRSIHEDLLKVGPLSFQDSSKQFAAATKQTKPNTLMEKIKDFFRFFFPF